MQIFPKKNWKEWKAWCKGGHRPVYIPSHPDREYRDQGWVSWPDWLGYEIQESFLPFEEARDFARALKLKSYTEWKAWRKGGHRPANIPSCPSVTYREQGWVSMSDWMDYSTAVGNKRKRPVSLIQ